MGRLKVGKAIVQVIYLKNKIMETSEVVFISLWQSTAGGLKFHNLIDLNCQH